MRRIASLLSMMFGVFIIVGCSKSEPKLEVWNIYKGEFAAYRVVIDESTRGGVCTRMIHLEPLNDYEEPTPKPFAMTGHDYDGDGQFERVFIREKPIDGYNAVEFTGQGKRVWEPCSGDKDRIQPFTDAEVASAQSQLYLAMAQTHDKNHIISTLEGFRAKQNQN